MDCRIEKSSDPAEYKAHRIDPAYVDLYKPSTMPDGIAYTPLFAHPKSSAAATNASGHLQWFRALFGSHGEVFVRLCRGEETDQLCREEFDRIMQVLTEKVHQIQVLLEYNAAERREDSPRPCLLPQHIPGELRLSVALPGTYMHAADTRRQEHVSVYFMDQETTADTEGMGQDASLEQAAAAVRHAIEAALERLPQLTQGNTAQAAARSHIKVHATQETPIEAV